MIFSGLAAVRIPTDIERSLTTTVQATVALIRALGGGWNERALPIEKQTLPFGPLDYRVAPPDVK